MPFQTVWLYFVFLFLMAGSRFIHLSSTDSHLLLFTVECYSTVYMYYNFLIHSSVDGHLGCFHVLTIVNSAEIYGMLHKFTCNLCTGAMLIFSVSFQFIGICAAKVSAHLLIFAFVKRNLFQYSFLENPMDRGDLRATVHVASRVGQVLVTKPPPPLPEETYPEKYY